MVDTANAGSPPFTPLYALEEPIKTKMEKIAKTIYGASKVSFPAAAERDLKMIQKLGYENLPICMAKTQDSLSDNPKLGGRPQGFKVTVRDLEIAAGAGFVVPLIGDIVRMPGLPAIPQAVRMDLVDGKVVGLLGG